VACYVDSYVKIEKDRINYCKDHQKELRTEIYQGLRDYIQTMANNSNRRIGKMVIHSHLLDHFEICYKTIKIQW